MRDDDEVSRSSVEDRSILDDAGDGGAREASPDSGNEPSSDSGNEPQYTHVPEWVSEFRRLYVEPKPRTEVREKGWRQRLGRSSSHERSASTDTPGSAFGGTAVGESAATSRNGPSDGSTVAGDAPGVAATGSAASGDGSDLDSAPQAPRSLAELAAEAESPEGGWNGRPPTTIAPEGGWNGRPPTTIAPDGTEPSPDPGSEDLSEPDLGWSGWAAGNGVDDQGVPHGADQTVPASEEERGPRGLAELAEAAEQGAAPWQVEARGGAPGVEDDPNGFESTPVSSGDADGPLSLAARLAPWSRTVEPAGPSSEARPEGGVDEEPVDAADRSGDDFDVVAPQEPAGPPSEVGDPHAAFDEPSAGPVDAVEPLVEGGWADRASEDEQAGIEDRDAAVSGHRTEEAEEREDAGLATNEPATASLEQPVAREDETPEVAAPEPTTISGEQESAWPGASAEEAPGHPTSDRAESVPAVEDADASVLETWEGPLVPADEVAEVAPSDHAGVSGEEAVDPADGTAGTGPSDSWVEWVPAAEEAPMDGPGVAEEPVVPAGDVVDGAVPETAERVDEWEAVDAGAMPEPGASPALAAAGDEMSGSPSPDSTDGRLVPEVQADAHATGTGEGTPALAPAVEADETQPEPDPQGETLGFLPDDVAVPSVDEVTTGRAADTSALESVADVPVQNPERDVAAGAGPEGRLELETDHATPTSRDGRIDEGTHTGDEPEVVAGPGGGLEPETDDGTDVWVEPEIGGGAFVEDQSETHDDTRVAREGQVGLQPYRPEVSDPSVSDPSHWADGETAAPVGSTADVDATPPAAEHGATAPLPAQWTPPDPGRHSYLDEIIPPIDQLGWGDASDGSMTRPPRRRRPVVEPEEPAEDADAPQSRAEARAAAREVEAVHRGKRRRVLVALVAVLLVAAVLALWWMTRSTGPVAAQEATRAPVVAAVAWVPDGPGTAQVRRI